MRSTTDVEAVTVGAPSELNETGHDPVPVLVTRVPAVSRHGADTAMLTGSFELAVAVIVDVD